MNLRTWGPATVLIVAVAIVIVVVGGLVTIVNPDTLTFGQYLDNLKTFALAVAGLAAARGLHLGLAQHGKGAPRSDVVSRVQAFVNNPGPDPDQLPHVPVNAGELPADEGDKGKP